jgi:hypothetical protein
LGGATIVPPITTRTFDADASVRYPSLPHQHVADERNGLEIAAPPAVILGGDDRDALPDLLRRRRHQRIAHHEHRRAYPGGKRMVALGDPARHLQIDALVVEGLPRDKLADDRGPLGVGVRIGEPDAVETVLQSREVLREPECLPPVHRDELVHAVAVDEAAVENGDLRVFDRE